MRAFPGVRWHLIPGNHDPHQPGGPWDRLLRRGLPDNVWVHLEPAPVALGDDNARLLPAPLARRRSLDDPTAWMDQAPTPGWTLRIGLAHGSISAFGSDATTQPNLIDPARPERAGLAYLALGDWHGMKRIGAALLVLGHAGSRRLRRRSTAAMRCSWSLPGPAPRPR